jgi:hypothetical protein
MIVIAIETGWKDRNRWWICQDSHFFRFFQIFSDLCRFVQICADFCRFFHVKISPILIAQVRESQRKYHGLSCELYFQSQLYSWPISCRGEVSMPISAPATGIFTLIYSKTLPHCARDPTSRTIETPPRNLSGWDKFLLSATKREILRITLSCSWNFSLVNWARTERQTEISIGCKQMKMIYSSA